MRGEPLGVLDGIPTAIKDLILTRGWPTLRGSLAINPQQDWVAEAAVERRFWGAGSIVLTARHFKITDAVDRAPIFLPNGDFFDAPANIGNGTKDELCQQELMQGVAEKLPPTWTMHWLEAADHGYHVLKRSGRTEEEVLSEIGEASREWVTRIVSSEG